MRATRRMTAAVISAAAAAAWLTGCGGDKAAGNAPLVAPVATSASTGPFAGESAEQVMAKAEEAMEAVSAVTVDVHTTDDDGTPVHLTSVVIDSGKCAATAEEDDQGEGAEGDEGGRGYGDDQEDPVQFIGVGRTYWMKAGSAYWAESGGGHGEALARELGGKWVKLPASQSADMDQFCDLHSFLDDSGDDGEADAPVTRGEPTTRYGRPVLPLREHEDDGTTTVVYVAAEGTPYILGLVNSDGDDSATFTGFNASPRISAPPARDSVDLDSVEPDAPGPSI